MPAQISMEAVFAVAIVLFVAVIVSLFVLQENKEAALLSENTVSKEACEKLASVIYLLSNSNAKSSIVFELDSNASVSDGIITIGSGYYCDFLGVAEPSSLVSGTFRAFKNSGGVVVFERV